MKKDYFEAPFGVAQRVENRRANNTRFDDDRTDWTETCPECGSELRYGTCYCQKDVHTW